MGSINPLPSDLDLRAVNGFSKQHFSEGLQDRLSELFAENITAKILRTAVKHLVGNDPPVRYPDIVPQHGANSGHYQSRNIDFWTCGFFPGCIYSLLERLVKYPNSMKSSTNNGQLLVALRRRLEDLGRTWSDPIHRESRLTNTHDLGFIMMPHMRQRWELYHDEAALQSIITSAKNLATRFSPKVGAIRSWDEDVWRLVTSGRGKPGDYIVIVDSMCNLELLFYAAAQTGHGHLSHIAETHARTVLHSHLRPEPKASRAGFDGVLYSSGHVVNFSWLDGHILERLTAQGHSPASTWSRGQAWAILGFSQTYVWTGKKEFLDVACGLAEYFLFKLETAPACVEVEVQQSDGTQRKAGRYVPMWDFSAPPDEFSPPLRDTSAGTCAANGMLVLSQALAAQNPSLSARYLDAALRIIEDTIAYSLSRDTAKMDVQDGQLVGVDSVPGRTFEAVLRNATVSNSPASMVQIRDHGLVYADYFLIEFGNRLLRAGLL
ncbi:Six-hairpin glycosidase-like protein [Thelonectria olida]|uniref:Six-hairpin glycosidase-like protein n=1 Tax=Thelonectria olida TaxID=1576542 RepID=A0A9P8VUC1_9HYPO|nr:Six-hairpin glycosidase-like protein [Thelonectria olida]